MDGKPMSTGRYCRTRCETGPVGWFSNAMTALESSRKRIRGRVPSTLAAPAVQVAPRPPARSRHPRYQQAHQAKPSRSGRAQESPPRHAAVSAPRHLRTERPWANAPLATGQTRTLLPFPQGPHAIHYKKICQKPSDVKLGGACGASTLVASKRRPPHSGANLASGPLHSRAPGLGCFSCFGGWGLDQRRAVTHVLQHRFHGRFLSTVV